MTAQTFVDDDLLQYLTPEENALLDEILGVESPVWSPLPGPQTVAYTSTADVIGYGGAAGGGKGLALNTQLPTPDGWIAMRDVQPGQVLMAEDGKPCRVVGVSGVSNRACFLLSFDDGTQIIADDVHRWVTFDAKELAQLTRKSPEWRAARRAKRPSRAKATTSALRIEAMQKHNSALADAITQDAPTGTIRDTKQLNESVRTASGRANHAVRIQGHLQLPEAELLIPPYTLGAWLGDGTSLSGGFTGEDASIWERIEQEGFEVRHYPWNKQAHSIIGLKVKLRALGVLGNKHIPIEYLRASYDQRLALLQGLMDTDGHAALDGGCEFDSISEALALGVRELVTSLGVKCTLQTGVAKLNGREISAKWRVKFTTTVPVFGMPRKLERLKDKTRRVANFRYLVSCEPIESVPTKCVAVDSPSRMYLAGLGMIPTHNTDLACGKALTQHQKIMILRRIGTELTGILDRFTDIFGTRDGYNGKDSIWRTKRRDGRAQQIEFGAVPNIGDEKKYQGRPHDLLVFDEAANFAESQVRFLLGWLRSVDTSQKCQALLTFNPPTTAEGRWIIPFFAPWLDKKHPNPATPGELRHVAMIPDASGETRDLWVETKQPFVMINGKPCFDFDPADYQGAKQTEIITPMTRTFIPSRITDNPHLLGTGYMSTLQALPEPLRSQMLNGDFLAGVQDDPWQVIPTAWVEAAQARWKRPDQLPEMDSVGVDVARGGQDKTILIARHGVWYDEPKVYPGTQTPDGPKVASLAIATARNHAVIHIDVIGVGSSPYDFLRDCGQQVVGVNVSESANATDRSGRLAFMNLRSQLWWQMREELDPQNNTGIALPPDPKLLADLCAPTWELSGRTIKVASREDIVKKIGRSPDYGSALVLARIDTPKRKTILAIGNQNRQRGEYNPYS